MQEGGLGGRDEASVVRESAPATAAKRAEITNAVQLVRGGVDAERARGDLGAVQRAQRAPARRVDQVRASQTAPTSAAPTNQYQDRSPLRL